MDRPENAIVIRWFMFNAIVTIGALIKKLVTELMMWPEIGSIEHLKIGS